MIDLMEYIISVLIGRIRGVDAPKNCEGRNRWGGGAYLYFIARNYLSTILPTEENISV